jgi:hypothetical protein
MNAVIRIKFKEGLNDMAETQIQERLYILWVYRWEISLITLILVYIEWRLLFV